MDSSCLRWTIHVYMALPQSNFLPEFACDYAATASRLCHTFVTLLAWTIARGGACGSSLLTHLTLVLQLELLNDQPKSLNPFAFTGQEGGFIELYYCALNDIMLWYRTCV